MTLRFFLFVIVNLFFWGGGFEMSHEVLSFTVLLPLLLFIFFYKKGPFKPVLIPDKLSSRYTFIKSRVARDKKTLRKQFIKRKVDEKSFEKELNESFAKVNPDFCCCFNKLFNYFEAHFHLISLFIINFFNFF